MQITCGVKLSAVSNCPFLPMVSNCPRCQIVRCQIVRQHCRCQIVRDVKFSWCQIVLESVLMSCSNNDDNANDDDDDDDEVDPLCWLQSDANFPIKGLSGPASPTFTLTPTFKTRRFLPRHIFLFQNLYFRTYVWIQQLLFCHMKTGFSRNSFGNYLVITLRVWV